MNKNNEELNEINVTPFIDVMLVLLIIFMIVTPLTTSSIQINLPSDKENRPKDTEKNIILYLKKTGEIYINENQVSLPEIEDTLNLKTKKKKDTTIFFHVDKSVEYEKLMKIVNRLVSIGYTKIALTSKKENSI